MNLYIIRHAIAVDEGTPEYQDNERPLTDKGRKKMRQIAKGMRNLGVDLDLILSSPYVRAKETAEVLAEVFKIKSDIAFSDNLIPMGDPDVLIAEINEKHGTSNTIALVGHEPQLTALMSMLVADNAVIDMTLKKGGVCRLSADDLHHSRKATLEWLLTPSILVEIADK